MTVNSVYQEIIEKLQIAYKIKGYVSEESVLDQIIGHGLSLDEVDYVCEHLLSIGVIINDESDENSDDNEDDYDRSQIDYDKLFLEVVAIDESLAPLIDSIRQLKPPQHREWENLMLQAKNNNVFAKQRIIEMYLRTVVRIALWHYQRYKFPLAETIQDGCVGLVIALDKYEIGRFDKFSTYAPWWIRQNILRNAPALNPSVYIPVHVKDKLFRIYDLLNQNCFIEFNSGDINRKTLTAVSAKLNCSEKEAKEYLKYLNTFASIEEIMEKEEYTFYDDCITEEKMLFDINKKEMKCRIRKTLQTLDPRQERVILLRYGFIDNEEWTLEEVGNEFGVTRERIRQIESKALVKLRQLSRSEILRPFLE